MQTTALTEFIDAFSRQGARERPFETLHEFAERLVGAKLFTVMRFDYRNGHGRRIYSNMPDAYPVSGTKPVNRTDWATQVLKQARIFVANKAEAFAPFFADHELLTSIGCHSVVNVPIAVGGEVIGTINCLNEADFYTEEKVRAAEALRLPGAACLLLNEVNARGGL